MPNQNITSRILTNTESILLAFSTLNFSAPNTDNSELLQEVLDLTASIKEAKLQEHNMDNLELLQEVRDLTASIKEAKLQEIRLKLDNISGFLKFASEKAEKEFSDFASEVSFNISSSISSQTNFEERQDNINNELKEEFDKLELQMQQLFSNFDVRTSAFFSAIKKAVLASQRLVEKGKEEEEEEEEEDFGDYYSREEEEEEEEEDGKEKGDDLEDGESGEKEEEEEQQEELMAYIKKHKEFVICVLIGLIIILGMWASWTSTFRILKNIEKMAKEREENGRNMFLERFHRSPRYYDLEEAAMVNGAKFPVYIHQAGKSPQRVETPTQPPERPYTRRNIVIF